MPWLTALALAATLEAPVSHVTVYSDRARVVRTAQLTVSGSAEVVLPILPDRIDADSVRVEAKGAQVARVDLSHVTEDALPIDDAKKAIQALEALDDQLAEVRGEHAALNAQLATLGRVSPVHQDEPLKPSPKLSAKGWAQGLDMLDGRAAKLHARLATLEETRFKLEQDRQEVLAKAGTLGAGRQRSGTRVTVRLEGQGPVTLTTTYLAVGARWYPRYDVQLDAAKGQVQVAFSGLVSQETGEDWRDAALTLSTAVPSGSSRFPTVRAWKLGEQERFIPTPAPVREQVRPAPAAPAPWVAPNEQLALRARLAQLAGMTPDALGGLVSTTESAVVDGLGYDDDAKDAREASKPMAGKKRQRAQEMDASPAPPPPPPRAPPAAAPMAVADKSYDFESEEVSAERVQVTSQSSSFFSRRPQPEERFGLAPPPTWKAPRFAADLPAAAAGGFDLAWASAQKESVPTGEGAKRVALFTREWPVSVERSLYPALFPEAYLVAELKNPSTEPLPSGQASLFVGADPAGTAKVPLVSPGEAFTLPLGIDRALTPKRRVTLEQKEQGVFSKTETTTYEVTVEVANPYPNAIPVRLYDQVPVSGGSDVEVKLVSTTPTAIQDKPTGKLEWRLTLPPGKTTSTKLVYQVTRPKGWRLGQQEVRR